MALTLRRLAAAVLLLPTLAHAATECVRPLYLTLDTGNMAHAEPIAATLARHGVRATFFLANERTTRGDHALDPSWADYWRARVAEGHAFGSHTWRHGRVLGDAGADAIRYRPQFGEATGRTLTLTAAAFCRELRQVDEAFRAMTQRPLDPLWRAPGGFTSGAALTAAQTCGYSHVHWAPAGFLGDELPSETHPNAQLLARALRDVRAGDVLIAHLGIWSRRDPFAPMLEPLLAGLRDKGFCFRPLTEHPDFAPRRVDGQAAALSLAAQTRARGAQ